MAALPPEIWAAFVAVFSQDLSAADLGLGCGVDWAEPGHSCWEQTTVYSCPGPVWLRFSAPLLRVLVVLPAACAYHVCPCAH